MALPRPLCMSGLNVVIPRNPATQIVLRMLRESVLAAPRRWRAAAAAAVGVTEESATGVKRLYEMAARSRLLLPAVNTQVTTTS